MMDHFAIARELLREFKGNAYRFGNDVLKDAGGIAASAGKRGVLVYPGFPGAQEHLDTIRRSVAQAGVRLLAQIRGAAPNAPREDLVRITRELQRADPDVVVSFGGGSTIDAVKAAEVLRALGGEIDEYFGTGMVTKKLQETGRRLTPHVAIQTAASSGAHLTKYSNITDLKTGQKKLIVDEAIVPAYPIFDYTVTHRAPADLTADGAMDGLAHMLEVFYGAVGKPSYDRLRRLVEAGIPLILNHLPQVKAHPQDPKAREALCLATDLGGYAIMLGGTNGGHLTSFSLVDILSHGRACALMNPYYTVFFAPAIEGPLRIAGRLFAEAGHLSQDLATLHGRDLGIAVARGMFAFARAMDFPTRLSEVQGFTPSHIERALTAAKNPQLKMKLENMPVPMPAEKIDDTLGPILEAAATGDISLIRNAEPNSKCQIRNPKQIQNPKHQ
jgi:alcohol dehydrogenase